jgi:8-oxo-dGTP diphosphatase
MEILTEIYRDQGLNLAGRTLERASAKAIIQKGGKLLLIHSLHIGGYKFPGGGVDGDETDEQTLAREIREECGTELLRIDREFGQVVEYKRPFEPEYDVFKMISRYYLCQVEDGLGELRLDDYEQELGYCPQWVNIDIAIQANHRLSTRAGAVIPGWIVRESYVLEQVKQNFFG